MLECVNTSCWGAAAEFELDDETGDAQSSRWHHGPTQAQDRQQGGDSAAEADQEPQNTPGLGQVWPGCEESNHAQLVSSGWVGLTLLWLVLWASESDARA